MFAAQVPFDYAVNVCNLFAQLGARGSSIMFSSGDDGVGAGNCQNNDGTTTKRFQPNFPASCPFVTTVRCPVGDCASALLMRAADRWEGQFASIPRSQLASPAAASRTISPARGKFSVSLAGGHGLNVAVCSYQSTAVTTFLNKLGSTNAGLFK